MKEILKNRIVLTVFTLALCLSISVGIAAAYFSDYEEASGGATLNLGGVTELTEGNREDAKEVVIENKGKTNMIVRVAIYGAEEFMQPLSFANKDDWAQAGDFYYYKKILKPGEKTSMITAEVKQSWSGNTAPEFDYEVTVVHESAQAVFNGKVLDVPEGWDAGAVASIAIPEVQKGVK